MTTKFSIEGFRDKMTKIWNLMKKNKENFENVKYIENVAVYLDRITEIFDPQEKTTLEIINEDGKKEKVDEILNLDGDKSIPVIPYYTNDIFYHGDDKKTMAEGIVLALGGETEHNLRHDKVNDPIAKDKYTVLELLYFLINGDHQNGGDGFVFDDTWEILIHKKCGPLPKDTKEKLIDKLNTVMGKYRIKIAATCKTCENKDKPQRYNVMELDKSTNSSSLITFDCACSYMIEKLYDCFIEVLGNNKNETYNADYLYDLFKPSILYYGNENVKFGLKDKIVENINNHENYHSHYQDSKGKNELTLKNQKMTRFVPFKVKITGERPRQKIVVEENVEFMENLTTDIFYCQCDLTQF